MKRKHKVIGGKCDGKTVVIDDNKEYVHLLYEEDQSVISNSPEIKQEKILYRVWDLRFVDRKNKEHVYNILIFHEMEDVDAMSKLVEDH